MRHECAHAFLYDGEELKYLVACGQWDAREDGATNLRVVFIVV